MWFSRRALEENRIVDITSSINSSVFVSYGSDESELVASFIYLARLYIEIADLLRSWEGGQGSMVNFVRANQGQAADCEMGGGHVLRIQHAR